MKPTIEKKPRIAAAMPAMLKHKGVWSGIYTHLDANGALLDQHRARVECEFPEVGPFHYVQRNLFTWSDGREHRAELPGELRNGKLWWDTETFSGCAWETDHDVILLKLDRKDEPDAYFLETIVMGDTGMHRARVWQWFKADRLFQRTLVDEHFVSSDWSVYEGQEF